MAARLAMSSGSSRARVFFRHASLALLLALSAASTPAQDDPPLERDFWDRVLDDPSLDGKLHLTYRAAYIGKFFDFGSYRFPFPQSVSPDDRVYAEELAENHEDTQDHDLDQYLSFYSTDLFVSEGGEVWQTMDFDASMRFYADLDGSPSGEAALNTFDAFSGNNEFQLLTLSATVEAFERHLKLKLGRQYSYEAEPAHFDGAKATFRGLTLLGKEVELSGFGGSRVRLWRQTSTAHQGIFGGQVKLWPTESMTVRLSDVYFIDNSFEAEIRQSFADLGWAAVTYRQVNEDPSSVRVNASLTWPRWHLDLYLSYVGKLGRDADDFDFDFTRSTRRDDGGARFFNLGDLAPYDEVTLELRKGLYWHYGLFVGGTLHRLRERDLEDQYNNDWQEVWVGADVSHAPWEGFTGRVSLRYLNTDLQRRLFRLDPDLAINNGVPDFQPEDITGDGEPDFLGLDLLVEQDFSRYLAFGVTALFRGYDYQSNYAFLEDLTAASVTTYVRWRPTRTTAWYLSYSYDRDFELIYPDLRGLHTVRLQFTWRF